LLDRTLRFTAEHDLDGIHLAMLSTRSKLRLEQGDWDGALVDAEATLATSGLRGANSILPLVARGRIHAARGHPEAHATLDQAARAAAGVGDVPMIAAVVEARSEYFFLTGDAERAHGEARRGLEVVGAEGGLPFIVGRLAWRLWRAGGHSDEVPEVVAEPYRWMIEGEWEKAAQEWSRRGATYLWTEALALGDEAAASEALRVLDGLGATRAAQHLRAELRRRGFMRIPRGPRRATAANSAGLTPREVDVLGLLVEGLTDAEIADRLTLSPKTVGHHISSLLGKLGVSNRGQAAAAAHRRNLLR
jgi:DNA-binding CsgD family transcriptional regulator